MNTTAEQQTDFEVALDRYLRKPEGSREDRVLEVKARVFCEGLLSTGVEPQDAADEVSKAVKKVTDKEHWQKNWDAIDRPLDRVADLCEGFLGLTPPEEPPAGSIVEEADPSVVTVESLTIQPPAMEPEVAYSDSTSDPGHAILVTLAKDSGIGPEDLMPQLDTFYAQEADALREKNPKGVLKLRKAAVDLRTKIAELDGGRTALASWYCAKAKVHAQSSHYAIQHMGWLIGGVEFYMEVGDACLSELLKELTAMGRMKDGELVPPPPKVVAKPVEKPSSIVKATIVVPPLPQSKPEPDAKAKAPEVSPEPAGPTRKELVEAFVASAKSGVGRLEAIAALRNAASKPEGALETFAPIQEWFHSLLGEIEKAETPVLVDNEQTAKALIECLGFIGYSTDAMVFEQDLDECISKRREELASSTKPTDVPLASDSGSPDMSSGDSSSSEEQTVMTTSTNGAPAPVVQPVVQETPTRRRDRVVTAVRENGFSYLGTVFQGLIVCGVLVLLVDRFAPNFSPLSYVPEGSGLQWSLIAVGIAAGVWGLVSKRPGRTDNVIGYVGVAVALFFSGSLTYFKPDKTTQVLKDGLNQAAAYVTPAKADAPKTEEPKQEAQVPKPVDTSVPKEKMADGSPFKPEAPEVQPVVPKAGLTLDGKSLSDAELAFFGQGNDQSLFGVAAFLTEGKPLVKVGEEVVPEGETVFSVSQENLDDYRAIVAWCKANSFKADYVSRGAEILNWMNAKAGPNGTVVAQDPADQGIVDAWLQALKQ